MADYTRDRRDFSSGGGNHYGPGGSYRGRGRGRGGGFRGRGRGGARGRYPHDNRRRPPPQGNRFTAADQVPANPKDQVLQSLITMVNAVGTIPPTTSDTKDTTVRSIVKAQADNISSLTNVLVGSNASMFFDYQATSPQLHFKVGPLASSLVHAVSLWPLQGPCYAALTLCLEEHATQQTTSFAGFATRTLDYAIPYLARDLDALVLVSTNVHEEEEDNNRVDLPRAMVRVRLMVQYLALLAKLGILQVKSEEEESLVPAATHNTPLTLCGFLQALVQAAMQAADRYDNVSVACLLAMIVLHVVPVLTDLLPREWMQESLVEPLERIVQQLYTSDFQPGVGRTAILLKGEQMEDVVAGNEQEDNEDEEDDDEEEEGSGQVCDSLQDLLRSVQHWMKQDSPTSTSRFALFTDAPWEYLQAPVTQAEQPMEQEGQDGQATEKAEEAMEPLTFTNEPAKLAIFPICKSLTMLLGGDVEPDTELAKTNLDGLVFGRLPIFGPPPEVAEDDDDEDMEDSSPSNERLDAYKTQFGLVDRYFFAQAVRDIVLLHESCVSDAGVDQGTAKGVAEIVWSLSSMVRGGDEAKGIEYAILESILSLVVQASPVSPFRLVYLCRVVLELTRLAPAIMSPAIALAVSNLFQDYMPALVPSARYNLSQWFAFHLTGTDYQWPSAYWKHWEPFVLFGWRNSRGAFVKGALALMAENLGNPELLITDCLPKESPLADHIFASPFPDDPDTHPLASLVDDIKTRMWDNIEDAGMLLSYLIGDEVSESVAATLGEGSRDRAWLRTSIMTRAALTPVTKECASIKRAIENARDGNDDAMDDDELDDSLAKVLDIFRQYKETFVGVLAKDTAGEGSDSTEPGEVFLLERISAATVYSRALQEGLIRGLLQEDIVRPLSVMKWSLGDIEGGPNTAILRWWELVVMTFHFVLAKLKPNKGSTTMDTEEGDNGEPTHVSQAKEVLSHVEPLLSYCVRRVCSVIPEKDSGSSKLSPEQVDLVEGLKLVVLQTKFVYFAVLGMEGKGHSKKRRDVEDVLLQSAIVKQALSSLGTDSGNATVGLLQCWQILENV